MQARQGKDMTINQNYIKEKKDTGTMRIWHILHRYKCMHMYVFVHVYVRTFLGHPPTKMHDT